MFDNQSWTAGASQDVSVTPPSWSYSASGLPAGVTIHPTTGQISGTPTATGTGTATITSTDMFGTDHVRTFTWTVEASAFVPDYIIDPDNGDWSATYPDATVLTSLDALNVAEEFTEPKTFNVGLAAGSRIAPQTNWTPSWPAGNGRWETVGAGQKAFIDCSLPVTTADISAHPTHANVYVVEITHAVAPYYAATSQSVNGPHVGMWWETASTGLLGEYLEPYFDAADIAAGEAFVRDNPGRCFVHKVGSTTPDVRNETTGSALRYVFQLADSSNPTTGGNLRYACYHQTGLRWDENAVIKNVIFGRNTRKDCTSTYNQGDQTGSLPTFEDCAWVDTGCHANVGPSNWKRCIAYSRTPGAAGGGGWHNFVSTNPEARIPDIEDCYIDGYFFSIYSHGDGQSPYVLNSATGRRLRLSNSRMAIALPVLNTNASFEDVWVSNAGTMVSGFCDVTRFIFEGTEKFGRITVVESATSTLTDGLITTDDTDVLNFLDISPWTNQDSDDSATFVLTRLTFAKPTLEFLRSTTANEFLNLTISDSVVGRSDVGATTGNVTFFERATITNSYFGPTNSNGDALVTVSEYQSFVPGVGNDVIPYSNNAQVTFSGDPVQNPTITGPANVVSAGMGVSPTVINTLRDTTLSSVPTLASMGLIPNP